MRGRVSAAVVTALVLAAIVAPAASAACPNEAFRTGPSAQLPECRAYEQVTPVDKESGFALDLQQDTKISSSGGGILFSSLSAYGDAEGNGLVNPYVATRGPESWLVNSVGGRQAAFDGVLGYLGTGASDDLSRSLVVSKEALAPGAVAGGSNIYVRDNVTGSYVTVAALGESGRFGNFVNRRPLVSGSSDWSTVLISSEDPLTPGAPGGLGRPSLYEFADGRLRLAVPEAFPVGTGEPTSPNVMSADGSRFFYGDPFDPSEPRYLIYLHQRGEEPLLVSEYEGHELSYCQFLGATTDAGIAFLLCESNNLYRFEASAPAGEKMTLLTPPVGPAELSPSVTYGFVGEDGSTVYFLATGQLTADAAPISEPGGYDIYAWHGDPGEEGAIRYLGQARFRSNEKVLASVSPNGRYFGLQAAGAVTPDAVEGADCAAAGGCTNVFLYSYAADRMSCISCTGSPATGSSQIGGAAVRKNSYAYSTVDSVQDDGSTYFDSPEAVVPGDVNGVGDAYRWRDGRARLISTGTSPSPSNFVGASADGVDVFFSTFQGLVGQDVDGMIDIYDARLGGGLPQAGPAADPSCTVDEDCRSGIVGGSPRPEPGTGSFHSDGDGSSGACSVVRRRADAADGRSRLLRRRAATARGRKAKALGRRAARATKVARRLGRRAGNCWGGRR